VTTWACVHTPFEPRGPTYFLSDRDLTDTPLTVCVPYDDLKVAAKWTYYVARALKDLRRRAPRP